MRARRRQLDLTQAELGKRASCSEATVRKIESDERKPSRQLAELLAQALSIPPNETQRFLAFARGAWLEEQEFGSVQASSVPNNLPGLLTSTIDRVRVHAAVTGLLRDKDVRLVTLIGPPGIGKTRLSIHVGNALLSDFPDGVWFVDLSEVREPTFFIHTLARALENADLPPSPNFAQLVRVLCSKRMLLILDNFEQIIEAGMEVAQLLKACSNLKLLVTSRLPLHIYGEFEYPLTPLTVPPPDAPITPAALMQYESIQMFVARVRMHQPDFSVDSDNADAVKQICLILEGIPLAIELAAASLRQFSLAEMVQRLQGCDWVLHMGTPARDLPMRQRTLENVIEWSYELLNDSEKIFYARLGVLSGLFDLAAAAAVTQTDEVHTQEQLRQLSNHSLLLRESTPKGFLWRMLEIIRAHAYLKLQNPEKVELLRARYYLEQMQKLQQNASRAEQEAFFILHLSNLHGALDWLIGAGKAEQAFLLTLQLSHYWEPLGYLKEGLKFCEQLSRLRDDLQPNQRATLARIASDLAWQQHDFDTALLFARQSVDLGQEYGLVNEYPLYLNRLGRIYIEQGRLADAKATLHQVRERCMGDESVLNPGIPLAQLGEIALFEGKHAEARSFLEQALPLVEKDEGIFLAMTATDLAEVALESGEFQQAFIWLTRSLQPSQSHIRRLIVFLCSVAGFLATAPEGSAEMAARFYGAIDGLCERLGLPLGKYYAAVNQRRMQIARQGIPASAWQAAFEAGKVWRKEDVLRNLVSLFNY